MKWRYYSRHISRARSPKRLEGHLFLVTTPLTAGRLLMSDPLCQPKSRRGFAAPGPGWTMLIVTGTFFLEISIECLIQ